MNLKNTRFVIVLLFFLQTIMSGCTVDYDLDKDLFQCNTDNDCGVGYICLHIDEGSQTKNVCVEEKVANPNNINNTNSQCTPGLELCDGIDNNCNGYIDEVFENLGEKCTNGTGKCLSEGTYVCTADKQAVKCTAIPKTGSEEVCDGLDNDCDGGTDEVEDLGRTSCGTGDCQRTASNCVNGQPNICTPGEPVNERCDNKDNDCNGDIDDGLGTKTCGVGECERTVKFCNAGVEQSCIAGQQATEFCDNKDNDCDGFTDEELGTITCGQGGCEVTVERCLEGTPQDCVPTLAEDEVCDNVDNDCNGYVDEELGTTVCGKGACKREVVNCINGESQTCVEGSPSENDVCDGIDNNCDGFTDENFGTTVCGKGECKRTVNDCFEGQSQECIAGTAIVEFCDNKDNDCDGLTDEELGDIDCGEGICKRTVPKCINGEEQTCTPGTSTEELCDNKDNDCDGLTDEELGSAECGQGACKRTVQNCFEGQSQPCIKGEPSNEVCDRIDNDCNGEIDDNLGITECGIGECRKTANNCLNGYPQYCFPGSPITEFCDNKDNDCDGNTDEELGDVVCGEGICERTVPKCLNGVEQTCSPGTSTEEVCDTLDNDCDGFTDEELGTRICGKGECEHEINNCDGGIVTPCDDMYGAAEEICDKKDNDCDGYTDEGLDGTITCGKGECEHTVPICIEGEPNECDSLQGSVEEICDTKDNDCDGNTDEGFGETICGKGECEHTIENCITGIIQTCDDMEGSLPETCDGLDNDCDGETDENLDTLECSKVNVNGTCFGTELCVNGNTIGCNAKEPTAEICDGKDNDCDGNTDEDWDLVGQPCDSQDIDKCENGVWQCHPGTGDIICVEQVHMEEVCDGLDNDCDGNTDENLSSKLCNNYNKWGDCYGVINCLGVLGWEECPAGVPDTEVCGDGEDNDCTDGDIPCPDNCTDEDKDGYGIGPDCETELDCNDNSIVIHPGGLELCDNKDNDCDGLTDENEEGNPYVINCGSHIGQCVKGERTCENASWTECSGVESSIEICDGLDNDCDGIADNGISNLGSECTFSNGNCSVKGSYECNKSGTGLSCRVDEDVEVCDYIDNDCDGLIDEDCDCDGNRWISIASPDDNCISAVELDKYGGIWVGHCKFGRISRYYKGNWTSYENTEHLLNKYIKDIMILDSDEIWILAEEKGLVSFNHKDWSFIDLTISGNHNDVTCIKEHPDSKWLYAGTATHGLYVYDLNKITNFTTDNGLPSNVIFDLTIDREGFVWIATQSGVVKYNPINHDFTVYNTSNNLKNDNITIIIQDSLGQICAGQNGGWFSCFNGSNWSSINISDAGGNDFLIKLGADSLGGIWATAQRRTMRILGDQVKEILLPHQNFLLTRDFAALDNGQMLFAAVYKGLYHYIPDSLEGYIGVDSDGDGKRSCDGDCNDDFNYIVEGAEEYCDDIDNDCDGKTDEDFDLDEDGFPDCGKKTYYSPCSNDSECIDEYQCIINNCFRECDYTKPDSCPRPDDTCLRLDSGVGICYERCKPLSKCSMGRECSSLYECPGGYRDCDDTQKTVNKYHIEICGDELDNDCDGTTDNLDEDGDSYYPVACEGTDCNDTNEKANPIEEEICDGIDNNCDGSIDENSICGTCTINNDCEVDGYVCYKDDLHSECVPAEAPLCNDCSGWSTGCGDDPTNICILTSVGNRCGTDCSKGQECPKGSSCLIIHNTNYSCDNDNDCPKICTDNKVCKMTSIPCETSDDCSFISCDITAHRCKVGNNCFPDNWSSTSCYIPSNCDYDNDNYDSKACGGIDCNDHDFDINPTAPENCNGKDDDCDGKTDEGSCWSVD